MTQCLAGWHLEEEPDVATHEPEPGEAAVEVDTEAEPALAERYQVRSIPFLMVFHHGKPVAQRAGATGRAELRRWLEAAARES